MKKTIFSLTAVLFSAFITFASVPDSNRHPSVQSCMTEGRIATFNTDDGGALQLKFCSPSVIRVWYSYDGKVSDQRHSYAVIKEELTEMGEISIDEQSSCYEIFTGPLRVRIEKSPLCLQIFDKYQKLVFGDYMNKGHVLDGKCKTEYKVLRRDEHFFGLGEKTGKLDRRGESYKMWNSDKPCYSTVEDPLYKSIPFFMSNYRYGIFLDNTYKTEFKFGTESRDYYSFEAPDGDMVYYFIFGKDYKDMLGKYVGLTGKAIMPPYWALGFSQCRGLLTNEDLTYEIAEGYRERGIPCDVIYQDIGWTQNLQDFEWRKGNYRNSKKMLSDLDSMGFKVILSQDPVISQNNVKQWTEADQKGYFTTDIRTGKTYDMPWPWGGNCGVVDFTLPEVADWWGAYQQKPIDDGACGFWTDMGEPAWSNEDALDRLYMQHHDGMHDEIHNVFGLTWDKVVKEQFEKRNPDRRIFQMTRSAFAGIQRYSFGWTGDSGCADDVTKGWAQMANQIPVLLSAGLGLIPFTTCDISGYCGDIDDYPAMAELYIRWIQMGAFNPLSRIHHEGNVAVEPWLFGSKAEHIAKSSMQLKYSLMPYIYTYAREAHDLGLPIMRPMFLEFPMDTETFSTDEQFMFGEELLVAPVVKKGKKTKNVYLPEGTWIDFNDSSKEYEGEQWVTVPAPLDIIPMFIRKGSIIPRMPQMNYIREKRVYPITFDIYPGAAGETAQFVLYEDDGEDLGYLRGEWLKTPITAVRYDSNSSDSPLEGKNGLQLKIGERNGENYTLEGKRNFIFNIKTTKVKTVLLDGMKLKKSNFTRFLSSPEDEFNTVWTYDKSNSICHIRIQDDGKPHELILVQD